MLEIRQVVEMSKSLPPQAPMPLQASFSSLLSSVAIHPLPFVVIRPALSQCGIAFREALHLSLDRKTLDENHPYAMIQQCLAAWVDSALGKGKHGRGKGMGRCANGIGIGENTLGERAWTQLQAAKASAVGQEDAGLVSDSVTKETHLPDVRAEKQDEATIVAWIGRAS